jgi:hypothetical protein
MTHAQRFSAVFRRSRIRNLVNRYPRPAVAVLRVQALPTAFFAECTCPEFCERDHDNE